MVLLVYIEDSSYLYRLELHLFSFDLISVETIEKKRPVDFLDICLHQQLIKSLANRGTV